MHDMFDFYKWILFSKRIYLFFLCTDHIDIYSELPEDMDTRDLPQMDNRQFDGAVSMK